jgi:hypothetical protein
MHVTPIFFGSAIKIHWLDIYASNCEEFYA